jgi:hypothetical protein
MSNTAHELPKRYRKLERCPACCGNPWILVNGRVQHCDKCRATREEHDGWVTRSRAREIEREMANEVKHADG